MEEELLLDVYKDELIELTGYIDCLTDKMVVTLEDERGLSNIEARMIVYDILKELL